MRGRRTTPRQAIALTLMAVASASILAACDRQVETTKSSPRPVRTTTIEKRESLMPLTFTGRIEAEDEVSVVSGSPGVCLRTRPGSVTGSRPGSCWRNWSPRTS